MKKVSVFKSEKGRDMIREYYNNILSFFPLVKRNIDTSFGKTFVLESGSENKEAVILLHGSCSNSAAWLGDIGALSEQYHVFAVDVPGEPGNSEDIRLDIESNEYTQWLNEVLDLLGVEKAVLMGNSMGGWIALHFAAEYPDKTKALVLMAPSGIISPKNTFMEQVVNMEKNPEARVDTTNAVLGDASLPKEVIEFMMLVMENFNPITAPLSVLMDEQMSELVMPVLYLAGINDMTMDTMKASERLTNLLPQVTVKLNENSHVIATASETVIPFLSMNI